MDRSSMTPEPRQQTRYPSFNSGDQQNPADDLIEYVTSYARENPGTAALWCFGIGFILGWKLKPW